MKVHLFLHILCIQFYRFGVEPFTLSEKYSGKVGKMRDKFRKGGGEFRKNDRISDPKGGILYIHFLHPLSTLM